jgi:hypothetical protein
VKLKLVVQIENFVKLTGVRMDVLANVRLMAIRRGVWFKVLSRLERGLIDLSLKMIKAIRSKILARAIYSIVKKLQEALEGKVHLAMQKIGISLAEKTSRIAQNWGNKTAHEWAKDLGFIQYLTIMSINAYPRTC